MLFFRLVYTAFAQMLVSLFKLIKNKSYFEHGEFFSGVFFSKLLLKNRKSNKSLKIETIFDLAKLEYFLFLKNHIFWSCFSNLFFFEITSLFKTQFFHRIFFSQNTVGTFGTTCRAIGSHLYRLII